jgi:hypothetical protein
MFAKIKSAYGFVRTYPKLSLVIIVLVLISARMFVQNYSFQPPVVNKRSESYVDVWNGRAECLTELSNLQTLTSK